MSEGPDQKNAIEPPPPPVRKPVKPAARDDIGAVTSRFIQEIDSLADTLPLAMRSIAGARKSASEELAKFLDEHGQNRDEERHTVQIGADDILRLNKLSHRVGRVTAASTLVPRSFFVTLVSQYDAFLGRLIEALLLTKPEVLNASEKTLSFSELLNFGSIDAARDHIVEKEVESVLRKSHPEQFDWLESKFNIKLRHDLPVWPLFVEITERRNLFVHTGGQVSSQYLQNCQAHKVDYGDTDRGKTLSVNSTYYQQSYKVIFEIGVKLANVLWRRLKPGEIEEADKHLASVTYSLLAEEKYDLAKSLLDFASEVLKKHASSENRLRFVVNRVQAYKWSGEPERAREILDKEDFSALSDVFKLAEAVLRDDFKRASDLVKRIGRTNTMTLGMYREWPLFRELRKQPEFEMVIFEVFGEPLNKITIQPSDGTTVDEAVEIKIDSIQKPASAAL
ncbi:MAG: hypothetical protein ABI833_09010 [Acidobacteriota bacterium]